MTYTVEAKINAIAAVLMANTPKEQAVARENLGRVMDGNSPPTNNPEEIVADLLFEVGTPDHLVGCSYLLEAILLCLENRDNINSIVSVLYPSVAAKFSTTGSRVERGIRHAIEVTFDRADPYIIQKYFGNAVSPQKGKLTNSEFIARVANIARRRIRRLEAE